MAAVTMVAGLCVAFSVTSCGGDDGVETAPPIPDSQGVQHHYTTNLPAGSTRVFINSTKNREAGQTAMFVMTWGLNAQGEFSGNIQRSYANAASSTASYQASWYNAQQSVDLYDNYYDAD